MARGRPQEQRDTFGLPEEERTPLIVKTSAAYARAVEAQIKRELSDKGAFDRKPLRRLMVFLGLEVMPDVNADAADARVLLEEAIAHQIGGLAIHERTESLTANHTIPQRHDLRTLGH
ncbi:MAG TPA: hypothetical protein VLG37_02585 [Candidatus Saccharimonadales bacterium]|nr:hypothetical protein [Candidatus Saccharimonadales bacterium]